MQYNSDAFRRALVKNTVVPIPLGVAKRFNLCPVIRRSKDLYLDIDDAPTFAEDNEDNVEPEFPSMGRNFKWNVGPVSEQPEPAALDELLGGLSPDAAKTLRQVLERSTAKAYKQATHMASASNNTTSLGTNSLHPQNLPEFEPSDMKTNYNYIVKTPEQRLQEASAMYEKSCDTFLQSPSQTTLLTLLRHLEKVRLMPNDTDRDKAYAVVHQCEQFLDNAGNDRIPALFACQIIVCYQSMLNKGKLVINSEEVTAKAAQTFLDMASVPVCQLGSAVIHQIANTTQLWIHMVNAGGVPEHLSYMLLTTALQWVFGHLNLFVGIENNDSEAIKSINVDVIRARSNFRQLYTSAFTQHKSEATRDQLRAEYMRYLLRSLVAYSTNGRQINAPAALLLDIVTFEGSLPAYVWSEAVSQRGRKELEKLATKARERANLVCTSVSRALIESVWMLKKSDMKRQQVRWLLQDVAKALLEPDWPAAEMFIVSFTSTLFRRSTIHRTAVTYPSFAFDMLSVVHDSLAAVSVPPRSDLQPSARDAQEGTLAFLAELERLADRNLPAALFLATRQFQLPDQPVQDINEILRRAEFKAPKRFRMPGSQRINVLRQFPIRSYYWKIMQSMLDMLERDDLPFQQQSEILRIVEQGVSMDPSAIEADSMLKKLETSSASMCEVIVRIVHKIVKSFDASKDPLPIIKSLTKRMDDLGLVGYKRRCIHILAEYSDTSYDARIFAWRLLLTACLDNEASVREAGSTALSKALLSSSDNDICEILSTLQQERPRLIRSGFKEVLSKLKRGPVCRLVFTLLDHSLTAAATILATNGVYMPQGRVKWLFGLAMDTAVDAQHRVLCLEMLQAAFTCVPRLIVGPRTSLALLKQLSKRLRVCTEAEIALIAQIMWSLSTQCSASDSKKRQDSLFGIARSAYEKLVAQGPEPLESTREQMIVTRQLVLLAGCVRMWPPREEILANENFSMQDCQRQLLSIVKTLAGLAVCCKDRPLKLTLVRTTFRVATVCPSALLIDVPEVDKMFKMCSAEDAADDLRTLFIEMLIEYLTTQTESPRAAHSSADRLFGIEAMYESDGAVVMLLRTYEPIIRERILSDNKFEAVAAITLIHRALRFHYLNPVHSLPQIIAASASLHRPVSDLARSAFALVAERYQELTITRIPTGLKLAAKHYDEKYAKDVLPALLLRMPPGRRVLREVLKCIVNTIREGPADYAALLIEGFQRHEMAICDAHYFADLIDDAINLCVSGANIRGDSYAAYCLYSLFAMWLRRTYPRADNSDANEDDFDRDTIVDTEPQMHADVNEEARKDSEWRRKPVRPFQPRKQLKLWMSTRTTGELLELFEAFRELAGDNYEEPDVAEFVQSKVPEMYIACMSPKRRKVFTEGGTLMAVKTVGEEVPATNSGTLGSYFD